MRTPLILNESSERYSPGDIAFYKNSLELIGDVEGEDVESNSYFVFDSNGQELTLLVDKGSIVLIETGKYNKERLSLLLKVYKNRVQTEKAKKLIDDVMNLIQRAD